MTSILLNDQFISLIDGTVDSDLIVLNSFVSVKTELNINEIISEPANQVKVENLIKDTIEQYGMTTNKVVILFPDSFIFNKPVFTESDFNKNDIEKLLPIELKASLGNYFKEHDQSYYLVDNFSKQGNYNVSLSMSVPVNILKFVERLIEFLTPEEINVSTENTGIITFLAKSSQKPENFVFINFLANKMAEIFIIHKNLIHSLFKIKCSNKFNEPEQISQDLRFLSDMLTYQFPDDLFQGSINSSSPGFQYKLNDIFPELNIEHYELSHILSNIQTLEETSLTKLLPYISLFGTLV